MFPSPFIEVDASKTEIFTSNYENEAIYPLLF